MVVVNAVLTCTRKLHGNAGIHQASVPGVPSGAGSEATAALNQSESGTISAPPAPVTNLVPLRLALNLLPIQALFSVKV